MNQDLLAERLRFTDWALGPCQRPGTTYLSILPNMRTLILVPADEPNEHRFQRKSEGDEKHQENLVAAKGAVQDILAKWAKYSSIYRPGQKPKLRWVLYGLRGNGQSIFEVRWTRSPFDEEKGQYIPVSKHYENDASCELALEKAGASIR